MCSVFVCEVWVDMWGYKCMYSVGYGDICGYMADK